MQDVDEIPRAGTIHSRRNLAEFDSRDPYAPKIDPGAVAVCITCHAIYHWRHWFFDSEMYFHESQRPETQMVECPACHKIRDRYTEGRVTLQASLFLTAHKDETLHLMRNEEERAKGFNPLERIVEITESEDGIVVTTTIEKLAQRIGQYLSRVHNLSLVRPEIPLGRVAATRTANRKGVTISGRRMSSPP